MYINIY